MSNQNNDGFPQFSKEIADLPLEDLHDMSPILNALALRDRGIALSVGMALLGGVLHLMAGVHPDLLTTALDSNEALLEEEKAKGECRATFELQVEVLRLLKEFQTKFIPIADRAAKVYGLDGPRFVMTDVRDVQDEHTTIDKDTAVPIKMRGPDDKEGVCWVDGLRNLPKEERESLALQSVEANRRNMHPGVECLGVISREEADAIEAKLTDSGAQRKIVTGNLFVPKKDEEKAAPQCCVDDGPITMSAPVSLSTPVAV